MFSGYMTPNQLIQFCDVPSFSREEQHVIIANGLRQAPISNWQRPLDVIRLGSMASAIDRAELLSREHDSLMANPVLIGRSDQLNGNDVKIEIANKTLNVGGMRHPIADLFELDFTSNATNKPLWILDGQHRIHGMGESPFVVDAQGNQIPNGSIAADELIPVVFIIDPAYQPKFLAKIFTEVTTEARKMDSLHGDWMQFAFDLGDYNDSDEAKLAIEVAIELTTKQNIDAMANQFYNAIKFNPHKDINHVAPFKLLTAMSFRKNLTTTFYNAYNGPGGTWPTPEELAICIVRFYRACVACDSQSSTNSRLFSSNSGLEKLAGMFFDQFYLYIADAANRHLITGYETSDWENFLRHHERLFDSSDWSLPNVEPNSVETNTARSSSANAAKLTFRNLFFNPTEFNGIDPATWMQGPGLIGVETNTLSQQFRARTATQTTQSASGGVKNHNIRGANHKMIRFKSKPGSQATITKVERFNARTGAWDPIPAKTAVVLTPGNNKTDRLRVTTVCYSDSSKSETEFTVLS